MKKFRCWTIELLEEKRMKAADAATYAIAHAPGLAVVADEQPQCAKQQDQPPANESESSPNPTAIVATASSKSIHRQQVSAAAESDDSDDADESQADDSDDTETDESDENE